VLRRGSRHYIAITPYLAGVRLTRRDRLASRRLDDSLEDVFRQACAAGNLEAAEDVLAVLTKWNERRKRNSPRQRTNDVQIEAMRAELERRKASRRRVRQPTRPINRDEKVRAALALAKARGVLLGNRTNLPEARAKGRAAILDAADQFASNVRPVIEQIKATGAVSLRDIARELNARGVRTARDTTWAATTVRNVLHRGSA